MCKNEGGGAGVNSNHRKIGGEGGGGNIEGKSGKE